MTNKSHEASGFECCVAHYDKDGNLVDSCKVCKYCKDYIRPENMDEECPARVEKEDETRQK